MNRLLLILLMNLICPLTLASGEAPTSVSFIDDLGRQVTIPNHPQRIVSVYDIDITIPLIELGVMPVGSHGRLSKKGTPYIRSSALLTGVDFDNSQITFIGATNVDLETIVKLKPDLIITANSRPTPVGLLAKIAPTISLDSALGAPHIYQQLAKVTHTEQKLAILERRYQEQINSLKAAVETKNITVSVMQPLRGKISVYHSYRSLGRVLRDAGFKFPPIINQIPKGERVDFSAERLPELDADIIFDPYFSNSKPQLEIAKMNAILPGFCQFLSACKKGHYVLVSRDAAISNSYAGLEAMTMTVQAHLTPKPYYPQADK
ncbi:ABC transporter substrate-binding protein [Marinomonas arenicola]|uniref:ABC transporter substrate-binding protein n=1 Tax=Marinomonas arenicola TaxID=569601 RepID=A0ABU9FZQ1_9GAMM